jgi:hypothetical protein
LEESAAEAKDYCSPPGASENTQGISRIIDCWVQIKGRPLTIQKEGYP